MRASASSAGPVAIPSVVIPPVAIAPATRARVERRTSAIPVIAAAAALLASCTVGPNYQRPEVPSPDQFRFIDSPQQAQSLADTPWFQVFDDPALQALIKDAIGNNLDLRAAVARLEEARARAGIAKSYYYPQVDGQFNAAIRGASGDNNAESDESVTEGTAYGFRLSWEIDLFGRLRRQREAALALVLASEQARRGVLVTLVGDVASNYFLLRELDLQADIARRTLKLMDETVTYFQNRLDGGVSNRLELDRIVAFRAETAATIPEIERQIAIIENLLSLILARPPGAIPRQGMTIEEALPPPIPPGLPTSLLERRPDVALAEQLLVAANADIGVAKSLFFPTISLTGFLGGVNGDLTSFLGGGGIVWSLTPGVFQPIFNAGRLSRNVEAMQARFDAALAQYQKAALNGYREVANALVTIQKLAEIRAQQQIGVTALRDASDLARIRYDSGLASYIEILTADQDLFARELQLAQTRGAELRARAELYRTLGGGWQP
jgi:multidrug efflux system outer membrane protein